MKINTQEQPFRQCRRRPGRWILHVLALGWLAAAHWACASTESPALTDAQRAAVVSGVEAFLDQLRTAVESRDGEAVRSLYVTDERFIWFEDGAERYATPDDVVQGLAGLPQNMKIATEYTNTRVVALTAILAEVRTGFRTRLSSEDGGGGGFEGVITMLLERTPQGWKIISGHTSSARRRP